jgi:UDP-N-acetylglucosamine:LPS N-acetylglucosamine transferase
MLRPWWREEQRFWVTFATMDAVEALASETAYWCHHPTNRNVLNLIRNTILALRICLRERPRLIISAGAGPAVPFFYIGKLLGAKTIFVEVVDRIEKPTLTGRLVRPVTDRFLVQWPEQERLYPRTTLIGRLL